MSHFAFLEAEWPEVHEAATRAESLAKSDPRGACFYARRALELAIRWMYRHDSDLRLPYSDNISALIHEPTFRAVVPDAVFNKLEFIRKLGNQAVHSSKPVHGEQAVSAVRELFHFCYWFARTYARKARPAPGLTFDFAKLPDLDTATPQTLEQLRKLEAELKERGEELIQALAAKEAEIQRLRAEIAQAKRANQAIPDTHDYSEAETRRLLIDQLLREAGWRLDQPRDREFEVVGMPNLEGNGYVDYVLWGDDGKPLGLVEAKRTTRDPMVGQQQAKLYADCLEKMYGQRPIIFLSNGYKHWIWDDAFYPPRQVQGFYKKDELELLIQRRRIRKPLAQSRINTAIVERPYQLRAIRRVCESFERDKMRKALLVMATGTGKTRTAVALVDLLMRCNWVKRVLFLADRLELVKQAVGAFKTFLPESSPVNLVTEKGGEGRVFVSTYPTMMGLIENDLHGEQRRFGVGHFDMVIIDEAHRSVFHKYRAIFEYFDAFLLGLTATPKDEIDRNTYSLFDLETGVPTDAYSLEEAVKDGYLVPFRAVSVPLKFQREGIRYDDLSEEEKEQWDAIEWDESGQVPDWIEPEALNKWLFNKDTVDKALELLMTRGLKVAGGDRLGKTIIFAKNHAHAQFIAERFDANYPQYKGAFARVIDYQTEYAQTLVDDFKTPDKPPHIAISVDMLDTGIDVPEVVNLVFFKPVRSKTKFWQMVGRGTRLCPDLFGPGQHKEFFYIFDLCGNLEFFSADPPVTEGSTTESLLERRFKARVELIEAIDAVLGARAASAVETATAAAAATGVDRLAGRTRELAPVYLDPQDDRDVRLAHVHALRSEIDRMNLDNFIVRPRRELVEKYRRDDAWQRVTLETKGELLQLAGLPSTLEEEPEEARRFDILMLNVQLAVVRGDPRFKRLRDRVVEIASALEELSTVPAVRSQLALIEELQSEGWWQNVTLAMLERARLRLRHLVPLIEKKRRKLIYTDFEDELGEVREVEFESLSDAAQWQRFREKARHFLRQHQDHITLHKIRWNEPLTPTDLEELERMLLEAGVGTPADLARAKEECQGLGLFIRSLVGLDREAAQRAFAQFLSTRTLSADQIEFINMIINYLTQHGVMDPGLLYESPFTDLSATGPEGLFAPEQIDAIVHVLEDVRRRAVA